MPQFERYIGIDYSGAQTPTSSLPGLRVYLSDLVAPPKEIKPPPSPRKYWTRRGIAEWLDSQLREKMPTIVGIDHAFSFPLAYFDSHMIKHNWNTFVEDFCRHWPTNEEHMYVDFIRNGTYGNAGVRGGNTRWRRITEKRTSGAKSVFHFDVPGSVAKSTHAGIPWLRILRLKHLASVQFWPFDGWDVKPGSHVIAEVYPSLWRRQYPVADRTPDQQDAYTVCRWLAESDGRGELPLFLSPSLSDEERKIAMFEGWILGVR
jgi:hypothetical protein